MSAAAVSNGVAHASLPARSSRDVWISLLLALTASLATFLVYTPRLQQWRGVGDRIVHRSPEYGRANALMDQVAEPWQTTIDPLHRVINWRKLFPSSGITRNCRRAGCWRCRIWAALVCCGWSRTSRGTGSGVGTPP